MTKEVIKEVEVEVIKEVPFEIIKEVIKEVEVEVIIEVPVEVIKEVEVEVVKTVQVEVIKEVIKEVPVEVVREVIREVPIDVYNKRITKDGEIHASQESIEAFESSQQGKLTISEEEYVLGNEDLTADITNENGNGNGNGHSEIVVEREEVIVTEGIPTYEDRDNLIVIEGIGPKIEELFFKRGIFTFRQVSQMSVTEIKDMLSDAGPRFRIHNPTTWPVQAELAADGSWDELREWQEKLDGGRM